MDSDAVFVRYDVVATLQRGGMGEVVLADVEDASGRRSRVVLKRLLAELLDDDRYLEMLLAEADVMSRLDHPNIVKVIDAPIVDGDQCVAMEYVHGKSLLHVLRRGRALGGLPPALALHVMSEVLRGLEYAHRFVLDDGRPLELVHRDITPGNVLVSFDGDVKVTDFGIAKSRISRRSTTVGVVKGTTRYLSPEQVKSDVVDARSDLFSAATVLVEMLSGEPLFDRGTVPPTLFAIASGQRPPIAELLPFPAPRLAAILERALALDPEARPASAEELRLLLESAAGEVGPRAGRDELAAHVCALFPEEQAPLAAFESSGSHAAAFDSLDLTYLFELDPPSAAGLDVDRARAELASMAPGAKPLDAEEFRGEEEALLLRELRRLGRIPGHVARLPGHMARLPGQVAKLPGHVARIPGQVARIPGHVARIPGHVARLPAKLGLGADPGASLDVLAEDRAPLTRSDSRPRTLRSAFLRRRLFGLPHLVVGALLGVFCTSLGHWLHPLWRPPLAAERAPMQLAPATVVVPAGKAEPAAVTTPVAEKTVVEGAVAGTAVDTSTAAELRPPPRQVRPRGRSRRN